MNQTLVNATVNATSTVDVGTASLLFFTVVLPEIFRRFFVFIAAPFIYPEMWWLLIHLVLTFILFEFYFERHHSEDLGWSAALANSIVAIFISMESLRAIYHHEGSPFTVLIKTFTDLFSQPVFADKSLILFLVLLLGALGIATALINYFHLLPRKVAFIISGHKTINLLAYFLIVVVWRYTHDVPLPIDGITIIALMMFGALLWAILFIINHNIAKKRARNVKQALR